MSDKKADTWMPLWIGAYLGDTMKLTTLQHGAYMLLLIAYWRDRKPLPDDDEELRAITKTERAEWKKLRPKLQGFFRVADGVWWHKRVEAEMVEADKRANAASSKARAAAEARWSKSAGITPGNAPGDASGNASGTAPGTAPGTASSNAPSMPGALPKQCPPPSPNTSAAKAASVIASEPAEPRPKRVQSEAAKAARAERSAAVEAAKEVSGSAAWDAYAAAYLARYGIPAVRNQVTASKFKQFAARMGQEDAPAVARYYVEQVADPFIVNTLHSVGLLLTNAESYHSRWSLWKAGRPAPVAAPAPSASRAPRPESAAHERRMNFAAYMRGENHADDQQRTIDIEAVVRD